MRPHERVEGVPDVAAHHGGLPDRRAPQRGDRDGGSVRRRFHRCLPGSGPAGPCPCSSIAGNHGTGPGPVATARPGQPAGRRPARRRAAAHPALAAWSSSLIPRSASTSRRAASRDAAHMSSRNSLSPASPSGRARYSRRVPSRRSVSRPAFFEHRQVLADGGPGDVEGGGDLARGQFLVRDQPQDGAAARLGDRLQRLVGRLLVGGRAILGLSGHGRGLSSTARRGSRPGRRRRRTCRSRRAGRSAGPAACRPVPRPGPGRRPGRPPACRS